MRHKEMGNERQVREPWALHRRYVSATGLFARYGERYVSRLEEFGMRPGHAHNA